METPKPEICCTTSDQQKQHKSNSTVQVAREKLINRYTGIAILRDICKKKKKKEILLYSSVITFESTSPGTMDSMHVPAFFDMRFSHIRIAGEVEILDEHSAAGVVRELEPDLAGGEGHVGLLGEARRYIAPQQQPLVRYIHGCQEVYSLRRFIVKNVAQSRLYSKRKKVGNVILT